jgi:hypothetical protein
LLDVQRGVDVEAETLYEAAGLGLARMKKDGWIEGLRGRGTWIVPEEASLRGGSSAELLYGSNQRREVNGLAETRDAENAFNVFWMHDPCYANDWHVRERRICELLLAKLPAIHQRHVDVQQHKAGAPLPHEGEGFRAIVRGFSFVTV